MRRHATNRSPLHTRAKAARKPTSDQAPGEETVQVNDKYIGGGKPPSPAPNEHDQHPTGG
ncbi:MAG: hypothetical protein ACREOM_04395 [Candidatus Dormibacteraceae bacterium]